MAQPADRSLSELVDWNVGGAVCEQAPWHVGRKDQLLDRERLRLIRKHALLQVAAGTGAVTVEGDGLEPAAIGARLVTDAARLRPALLCHFLEVHLVTELEAHAGSLRSPDDRKLGMLLEGSQRGSRLRVLMARRTLATIRDPNRRGRAAVLDVAALARTVDSLRHFERIPATNQDVSRVGQSLAVRRIVTSLAPHGSDGVARLVALPAFHLEAGVLRHEVPRREELARANESTAQSSPPP